MWETAGWGECHAEPVIHERGYAEPGEKGHLLVDARGGQGDRATSCGQSAVGPRGRGDETMHTDTPEADDVDEDASDVCGVCAEEESVSAPNSKVRAGEKKKKGTKCHPEGLSLS